MAARGVEKHSVSVEQSFEDLVYTSAHTFRGLFGRARATALCEGSTGVNDLSGGDTGVLAELCGRAVDLFKGGAGFAELCGGGAVVTGFSGGGAAPCGGGAGVRYVFGGHGVVTGLCEVVAGKLTTWVLWPESSVRRRAMSMAGRWSGLSKLAMSMAGGGRGSWGREAVEEDECVALGKLQHDSFEQAATAPVLLDVVPSIDVTAILDERVFDDPWRRSRSRRGSQTAKILYSTVGLSLTSYFWTPDDSRILRCIY
jgi:hypothetical protein